MLTRKELIERAEHVNSDTTMSFFVSTFLDVEGGEVDAEISAVLCAWASNGVRGEDAVQRLFLNTMGMNLRAFMIEYPTRRCFANKKMSTFYGMLTYEHLDALCLRLSSLLAQYGSIKACYEAFLLNHRCTYAHDAFVLAIGGGCGFPVLKYNSTFYRYNLILYWLIYKFHLWQGVNTSRVLLPCNDTVFECAYELGIVKKRMRHNLVNTTLLTDIGREWFGDDNFFKMYELLNFFGK